MAGFLNQLKGLIVNVSSESKWDDFLVDNQQEVIKYLADNDIAPLMSVLETDGLEYGITEAERQTILLNAPVVEIPQTVAVTSTPNIPLFQAFKFEKQAVKNEPTDIIEWDKPTIIDENVYRFDYRSGVIKLTQGVYDISASALVQVVDNNRIELKLWLSDNKNILVKGAEDSQYAARNNFQNEGSAQFNNFLLEVKDTAEFRLRSSKIGSEGNLIGAKFTIKKLK